MKTAQRKMNFQIERYTCRKLMTITQEEVEECFHFLKRKETKNIGSCCSSFLFVASRFPIRVDSLTNKSRGKKKKRNESLRDSDTLMAD